MYNIANQLLWTWKRLPSSLPTLLHAFGVISNSCEYGTRPRLDGDPRIDEMNVNQYVSGKNRKRKLRTYVWGNAQTGALGVKDLIQPQGRGNSRQFAIKKKHFPIRLPFSELFTIRFKQVSCGYGYTLFLAEEPDMQNHQVFGTGVNTDSQIGFHEIREKSGESLKFIIQPVPIDLPLRNRTSKVLQVVAGRAHSIFLTEEGCFSAGHNGFGQCGRPIVEKEIYANNPTIYRLRDLPSDVEKVFCGQDTTFFLTSKGEVYSCGWGADGQTGLGNYDRTWNPTLVKGDIAGVKIVQVSCAADCVLALSDEGQLFGWGNSEYRQLSIATDEMQLSIPRHLPFQGIGPAQSVSAGGTVCGVVSRQGEVFTWGYGLLGKGPELTQSDLPSPMPAKLFEAHEYGERNPVASINCGLMNSAVITERGDLYTWGLNDFGQLGLGDQKSQSFPLRVTILASVKQISLGVDHCAAIAQAIV